MTMEKAPVAPAGAFVFLAAPGFELLAK